MDIMAFRVHGGGTMSSTLAVPLSPVLDNALLDAERHEISWVCVHAWVFVVPQRLQWFRRFCHDSPPAAAPMLERAPGKVQ